MDKDTMARQIERVAVMKNLTNSHITQAVAALQLGLSVRQIRRLFKKYKSGGVIALYHQNKGKPNSRKISPEVEQQAIQWIQLKGPDFDERVK